MYSSTFSRWNQWYSLNSHVGPTSLNSLAYRKNSWNCKSSGFYGIYRRVTFKDFERCPARGSPIHYEAMVDQIVECAYDLWKGTESMVMNIEQCRWLQCMPYWRSIHKGRCICFSCWKYLSESRSIHALWTFLRPPSQYAHKLVPIGYSIQEVGKLFTNLSMCLHELLVF